MAAAVHSFCNYSNHSLHKTSHRGTKYLLEVCALSVHAFLHWCCLFVQSYSSSKFRVGIFGMLHIPTAILMLATSFFISSFPGAYQEVQPVRFVQSGQRSSEKYRRLRTFGTPPSHICPRCLFKRFLQRIKHTSSISECNLSTICIHFFCKCTILPFSAATFWPAICTSAHSTV